MICYKFSRTKRETIKQITTFRLPSRNIAMIKFILVASLLFSATIVSVSAQEAPQRPNARFAWRYYELFKRPTIRAPAFNDEGESTNVLSTTASTTTTTTGSPVMNRMLPQGSCQSPSDCGSGECCAISHTRFSVPQCLPLGRSGDYCKVGAEPANRTISYPNGETIDLTDVYTLFCPCMQDLNCVRNTCQESEGLVEEPIHNSIESEESFF